MDHGTAPPQSTARSLTASLDRWAPQVLSVLRIVVALLFLEHGSSKLFGFPQPMPTPAIFSMIWFAGVIELVGGVLVTLGLFTRAAAFIMSGEMAIAISSPMRRAASFHSSMAATRRCCTASSFSIWFLPAPGRGAWMRFGSAAPRPLQRRSPRGRPDIMRGAAPGADRPCARGPRSRRSLRPRRFRKTRNPRRRDR